MSSLATAEATAQDAVREEQQVKKPENGAANEAVSQEAPEAVEKKAEEKNGKSAPQVVTEKPSDAVEDDVEDEEAEALEDEEDGNDTGADEESRDAAEAIEQKTRKRPSEVNGDANGNEKAADVEPTSKKVRTEDETEAPEATEAQ